jgi:hypothetical protein
MAKQNKDINYEFKIYPEYNGHEARENLIPGICEENTGIRQRQIPEIKVQEASDVSFKVGESNPISQSDIKQPPKASSEQKEEIIEKISELKSESDLIHKDGGQNDKHKGFLSESESKPSFFLKALFTTLIGATLLRVVA